MSLSPKPLLRRYQLLSSLLATTACRPLGRTFPKCYTVKFFNFKFYPTEWVSFAVQPLCKQRVAPLLALLEVLSVLPNLRTLQAVILSQNLKPYCADVDRLSRLSAMSVWCSRGPFGGALRLCLPKTFAGSDLPPKSKPYSYCTGVDRLTSRSAMSVWCSEPH
jgi:hypothetical protein